MDYAYVTLGEPDKAIYSPRALEVYRRIGDLDEEASIINNLGVSSYLSGDWLDAIERYKEGREISTRVGNLVDSAGAAANLGEVLVNQGRYEAAGEPLQEALRAYTASGFAEGVAFTNLLLGRMYGIHDDLDASEHSLEESKFQSDALGLEGWKLEAAIYIADAKCRAGSPDRGLAILADAEASAPREFLDYYAPLMARIHGSILSACGRLAEAVDVLDRAILVADQSGDLYEHALISLTLARVAPDQVTASSRKTAIQSLQKLGVQSAPGISLEM
jgi:tetratricopeptide (TPR) repeat protein